MASSFSGRCAECVAQRKKCDLSDPSVKEWESIAREETRLRREKERLQREEEETLAKLLRLRRLTRANNAKKNSLKVRAAKMLRLDLKSFNELNALEETEKREAAKVATEATAKGEPSAFSSSPSMIFNFPSSSTSFWEFLDTGDKTPQAI